MKVSQLTKNSLLIFHERKHYLQSYDSIIAVIDLDTDELTIGKNWNQTKTNVKHLYDFISLHSQYPFFNDLIDEINHYNTRELGIKYMICHGKIKYDESLQ